MKFEICIEKMRERFREKLLPMLGEQKLIPSDEPRNMEEVVRELSHEVLATNGRTPVVYVEPEPLARELLYSWNDFEVKDILELVKETFDHESMDHVMCHVNLELGPDQDVIYEFQVIRGSMGGVVGYSNYKERLLFIAQLVKTHMAYIDAERVHR